MLVAKPFPDTIGSDVHALFAQAQPLDAGDLFAAIAMQKIELEDDEVAIHVGAAEGETETGVHDLCHGRAFRRLARLDRTV